MNLPLTILTVLLAFGGTVTARYFFPKISPNSGYLGLVFGFVAACLAAIILKFQLPESDLYIVVALVGALLLSFILSTLIGLFNYVFFKR